MIQAAVLLQPVPDLAQLSVSRSQEKVFEKGPRQINPADRIALEAALTLQDKNQLEVNTLSVSAAEGEKLLRETLALGAKRAVLIHDTGIFFADPFVVARLLGAAVRRLEASLVFAGPGQFGARVSEELGWDLHLQVEAVSAEGEKLRVNESEAALPAVVCLSGGYSPRMANPIKIMKAVKAEILRWNLSALSQADIPTPCSEIRRTYLPSD